MLLSEAVRDPDDRDRLEPGRVCQQLSKVGVVRARKLILDQDPVVGSRVLAEDVRSEWTDVLLGRLEFEFDPDPISEKGEVLWACEPWREVARLGGPHVPQINLFEASEFDWRAHQRLPGTASFMHAETVTESMGHQM